MEPVVLDIFTSSTTRPEPKKVFSPGESLQWNIVHTVRDGSFLGRPYKMTLTMEYWANIYGQVEGPHFDAVFKPVVVFSSDFTYVWEYTHIFWWYDRIPVFPLEPTLIYTDRRDTAGRLARGDEGMVFGPGIWKFTTYIRMTETSIGRPFGLKSDWHYLIVPS